MSSIERFEDLPQPYRRAAATVFIALAALPLWSWTRIGPLLRRDNPPWLGLAIGLSLSIGASWYLGRAAWRLLTTAPGPLAAPEQPPVGRYSPRMYVLAAIAFGVIGFGAPELGMRWFEGLPFVLLMIGSLGEAHRASRARAALSGERSLRTPVQGSVATENSAGFTDSA